jgi:hypothetical protein
VQSPERDAHHAAEPPPIMMAAIQPTVGFPMARFLQKAQPAPIGILQRAKIDRRERT